MANIVTISKPAIRDIMEKSRTGDTLLRKTAEELNSRAAAVFLSRNHPENEWDTSETTPPKYLASFRTRKIIRARGIIWRAINIDPGAEWVEYGSHAGGKTKVLEYACYRIALMSMEV